jgi:hypothetical protein
MTWVFDESLRTPKNEEVVAFLERAQPSAHSDAASELGLACGSLKGVRLYCPDAAGYAYVAAVDARGRIFALAIGQRVIALRLGPPSRFAAAAEGGRGMDEIGNAWACFDAFPPDEPLAAARMRIQKWCRIAHGAD